MQIKQAPITVAGTVWTTVSLDGMPYACSAVPCSPPLLSSAFTALRNGLGLAFNQPQEHWGESLGLKGLSQEQVVFH